MNRRTFLAASAATAFSEAFAQDEAKPNILWVTCEDMGPHLGCFGDTYAVSPNLDKFSKSALRYTTAWSNAPVCAPARTTIISGMYPPSTGSEHMRSETRLPVGMNMFPRFLRDAGYYCCNNAKEDYNLVKTPQVWDDSSAKAHWSKRKPGQPFFAVFNLLITHESQIRTRPHVWQHDVAKAPIPSYHPDTKEVREDWAQYYDNITTMDMQAGALINEMEKAGLAEDSIVFYYSDHGSGMPRSKRTPYNSGLHVPLMVRIPKKWQHLATGDYKAGGTSSRPISFVDLAPTVLSLAGIKPPEYHQGHAFLGKYAEPEQPYIYGFRGRMDERYDLMRTVRDKQYVYVRNYMPHRVYGQYIAYQFETPTTAVWKKLFDDGKLNPIQQRFWKTKPAEELYDLTKDKDEVNNLAASAAHQPVLRRMRKAQQDLARKIRDVGFLPECAIHSRAGRGAPYDVGHDDAQYPFDRVFAMAEAASSMKPDAIPQLEKGLKDPDSAVRFWAATGFVIQGAAAVKAHSGILMQALTDPTPEVQIAAGEALGRYGSDHESAEAAEVLLKLAPIDKHGPYVSLMALNALDYMHPRAAGYKKQIAALPTETKGYPAKLDSYVPRLIERVQVDLEKK